MLRLRRSVGFMAAMVVALGAAIYLPDHQVGGVRYTVGANMGWTSNVNYTVWAEGKHFYNGDWLYFVYDRYQTNVLEVNQTDYENCISDHFLHNWTTGAGRDVVPLNATRNYYFISGKGFCFGGMKVAIHVENASPPPPPPPPAKSSSSKLFFFFMPSVFAIAAVWDAFLLLI